MKGVWPCYVDAPPGDDSVCGLAGIALGGMPFVLSFEMGRQ